MEKSIPRTAEQIKENKKKWKQANPESTKKSMAKWLANNPEKAKNTWENFHRHYICNLIKKHHEDMKDDPERLTTAFIQNLIGIKCKKKEYRAKL